VPEISPRTPYSPAKVKSRLSSQLHTCGVVLVIVIEKPGKTDCDDEGEDGDEAQRFLRRALRGSFLSCAKNQGGQVVKKLHMGVASSPL
jgi:hypothetical protein